MKNKKQKVYCLLMFILVFAFLTACSSAEETEPKEEANASTEGAAETEVEEAEAETTETTAGTVAEETAESEPTAEPTPEPVVYEGIDMESTLPTAEWVQTFEGIINEPKLIVFNDSTNKKVILENGAEVDFALDDSLGIYRAGGIVVLNDFNTFVNTDSDANGFFELSEIHPKYESGDIVETKNIVDVNGEEITLTATLHLQ